MIKILFLFYFCVLFSSLVANDNDVFEKAIQDISSDQYEARLKAKKILDEAGLKAIPYLRKFLNHEDLEVREYAEQRIGKSINYSPDYLKPLNFIGTSGKTISSTNNMDEYYKFLNSFLWGLYEKNAKGEVWDAQMQKVIEIMCDYLKASEIDYEINDYYHTQRGYRKFEAELRKVLQDVSALGCNDPMFLFFKHGSYFALSDARFSIDELLKANSRLNPKDYSQYFNYFAYVRQNAIRLRNGVNRKSAEYLDGQKKILNAWIELGNEKFVESPIGQRRYYLWLTNFGEEIPISEFDKEYDKICSILKPDIYIGHMFRGWYHWKKALSLRVNENIPTKTEELKNFYDNLTLAEKEATAAYQKNIDSPDVATLMISILSISTNKDNIRLWFECGLDKEINNYRLYTTYYNAIAYRNNFYFQKPLALGREYLVANLPKFNLARFYLSELRSSTPDGLVRFDTSILDEIEWAVEQQMLYKPAYADLYYNDLAVYSFLAGDVLRTYEAIQKSKNLFSMGWYDYRVSSGLVERWSELANFYKNKSSGQIMLDVDKGTINLSDQKAIKLFLEADKEMELKDQYQLISLLLLNESFENIDQVENLWRLLDKGGYREALMTFYLKSSVQSKAQYATLIKNSFSNKYIEARKLLMKFVSFSNDPQKELADKIKAVFTSDGLPENELEKLDDYWRCIFLSYLVTSDDNPNSRKYRDILLPVIKKFSNQGEAIEFLCTSMNNFRSKNISQIFHELIMQNFFNSTDISLVDADELIMKLSDIKENAEFVKSVEETWKHFGKPYVLLQMIELCDKRKLSEDASRLKGWFYYCAETLGRQNENEDLMLAYSLVNGFSKEAYQIGCKLIRFGSCNNVGYIQAYHLFQLGHYQMAYEYLVKAQTYKDHGTGAAILNRKKFSNSDALLIYIVQTMLNDQKLPENIRNNLLDQFASKLKE